MNDETRKALVEELREAVRPELRFAVKCNGKLDNARDEAIAHMIVDDNLPGVVGSIMPIIDRLLSTRPADVPAMNHDELPQWWRCEGDGKGGWKAWTGTDGSLPQRGAGIIFFGQGGFDQCQVYGTTEDRDQKRNDLLEAAQKAGNP